MDFIPTSLESCFSIYPKILEDGRGRFVKTFHKEIFLELGLQTFFPEEYYSVSGKGVLRGLHFQLPPQECAKLVYCVQGCVFDAVVDLRRSLPTFGEYYTLELDAEKANMLYIPPGLAHGFCVLSPRATMIYKVSTVYSPKLDTGILWNSVGIPWPDKNPIVSVRDSNFIEFDQFQTPFY